MDHSLSDLQKSLGAVGTAVPSAKQGLFDEGAAWLRAQSSKFAAPLDSSVGEGFFGGRKGSAMVGALSAGALLGGPAGMAVAGVAHLATGGWLGRQASRAMLAVAAVGLSVAGRIYDALGRVYPDEASPPRSQRDLMGALGTDDLFGTQYRAAPPLKSVASLERLDRLAEARASSPKTTKTDPSAPSDPSAGGAGAAMLVKAIGQAEGPKPSVSKPEIAVARGSSFTEKDLAEAKKRLSGNAGASRSQREAERVRRMEERESAQAAEQADFVKITGLRPLGQNELQERVSSWRKENDEKKAVKVQAPTRGLSR
jgi:hypothetical protein